MKTQWHITEYSKYARQMARCYTRKELENMLAGTEAALKKYTQQHLGAIKATSSMQGNSSRRANARNKVGVEYEKVHAIRNAIEIHDVWPEYAKAP
jgi:flagellar basal body rod protein FlgB